MSNNFRGFFNHHETNSISDDIQRHFLLWRSVIAQAAIDATSNCQKTANLVEKRKAISWLSDFNQDFVHTCILANYDPMYVKNKINQLLKGQAKKSDKTAVCV